jgi:hypothetical protein
VSLPRYPWNTEPKPVATPPDPDSIESKPKPRGRRPASVAWAAPQARTTAPDWLSHHLTVSGPAETVDSFATAARGSGIIPWQLDFSAVEEDVFVRAISQPVRHRNLTVEGCRILARQFAERVAAHQAKAAALVGQSFACPFDLNVLLPVPAKILQLGPTHPNALAWLGKHWGTTDRLRQVVLREKPTTGRRLPASHAVVGYGFFTLGETPHAAIGAFQTRWPALRFVLQPRSAG